MNSSVMPTASQRAQAPLPDLGPFLVNDFGDRYLYRVNSNAFNKIGAGALFRRHFGTSLWQEDSLNLVVGTDSGLLLRHVQEHGVPAGSRFLFVEPPAVLEHVRPLLDLSRDSGRIALSDPASWHERARELRVDDYLYMNRLRVLRSVAAGDAHLADYQDLYWEVRQAAETLGWEVRGRTGNRPFIERHLENLAENRVPALGLKGVFAGATAVLLGGGPSLPRLFPWIRAHRDQILLMAVSRICRQLLEAAIQPDIVVSIDPHPVSFDVSKELLRMGNDTVLIHSFHVSPLLLGQWHGRSAFLGPRLPWDTPRREQNLGHAGPTVTNTAFNLALDLGVDQIVLGGVDLCFSREGFTHAAGSNEHRAGPMLAQMGLRVETNDGGSAESRQDFAGTIRILGLQAGQALTRGCRVINPMAQAARIPNVEHRPLDAIPLAPAPRPAREILREHLPEADAGTLRIHYRQQLKELRRARGRLYQVFKLAEEALACNEGLFGRGGRRADFKYKLRMDKIERRLDRELKDITPAVKSLGDLRFLRLVRPDIKEWTDREIERIAQDYYQAYRASAEDLVQLIEQAGERLQARLEEVSQTPDLPRILAQWQADGQPGRARLWRERHGEALAGLAPEIRAQLAGLEQGFDQMLANEDTGQMRWCRDEYSLRPVPGKARSLFQTRDREGLQRLSEGLRQVPRAQGRDLALMVDGYLAELAGRGEDALCHYRTLVEEAGEALLEADSEARSPVLEDALARIASLALEASDGDSALLSLSCLAAMSPAYEPSYAEILQLTGDTQEAISVYNDYLGKAPDDLATLLKLGTLYRQIGADESARMAFSYIAERDPQDRAAQRMLAELGG
jgi:tetratricopeptide (TPR) repeat protein